MDDLKKLSLEALRALARKHLGKGHSRLRTRAQLLEALKDVLREPLSRVLDAAASIAPAAADGVRVVEFPPGRKGRPRPARRAKAGSAAAAGPALPHEPRSAIAEAGAGKNGKDPLAGDPAPRDPGGRTGGGGGSDTSVRPERPIEEGFFDVPPVPRRPRRAPDPAVAVSPEPVALPREVGTEAPVLLVRDPSTLFAFWDFRRELERGAALGLREPRLLVRLYRGDELERSVELPLTARSTYLAGLHPGQEYTAEVLLLGRDGWTRPVGSRSGARRLPPGRASERTEVRMLRVPWSQPLTEVSSPAPLAGPRREPLQSPRRVPLPTSPGAPGPGRPPGGQGGPRSGRN